MAGRTKMSASSGHTTDNVPVEATDPGGTHPAPKGNATKTGKSDLKDAQPPVQSGDENDDPQRTTGNETPGADWAGSRPPPSKG